MQAFRELDRVLRGEARFGDPGVVIPLWPLLRVNALLAATYGVCMGVYGLLGPEGTEWRQMAAGAVKVPALFLLTLLVTFPSLYVFNTLLGPRLQLGVFLRLGVTALSVLTAVLSAFGPITAFFSVTTANYAFVVLLNVAVFALAGVFGLGCLRNLLLELARPRTEDHDFVVLEPAKSGRTFGVIYAWMVVFALVGGQMAWLLRPFIGSPDLPFAWLRPRDGSFFEGVLRAAKLLLGAA